MVSSERRKNRWTNTPETQKSLVQHTPLDGFLNGKRCLSGTTGQLMLKNDPIGRPSTLSREIERSAQQSMHIGRVAHQEHAIEDR